MQKLFRKKKRNGEIGEHNKLNETGALNMK